MNKKIILTASLIFAIFFISTPVFAAESNAFLSAIGVSGGRLIPLKCTDTGASSGNVNDCGLNEIMQTVVNFTQLLLGLTGSLALLAFLYGGVLWIISAGKSEMVEKGKQAITAAVIGLVIMLTSWLIVNTTIAALTKGQVGATAQIFNQNWFQTQKIDSPGSGASATSAEQPAENPSQNPATPNAPAVQAQPTPNTPPETPEEVGTTERVFVNNPVTVSADANLQTVTSACWTVGEQRAEQGLRFNCSLNKINDTNYTCVCSYIE